MRIEYQKLYNIAKERFIEIGTPEEVANSTVESLLLAESCGVQSHGIRMMTAHAKKIINKEYDVLSNLTKEIETTSFARFNCNNQIGMASAKQCMQYAIDKAKECGIFTVLANHCNTYSAAFVYSWQAAKNGCIGITFCNSPAQMAPIGGCEKLIGTNPLSYSIPASKYSPIIFDMATSIVAKSKINQALEKGENIPEGWALDIDGNPTTDPSMAVKGLVLPIAGPKGYGLAMMIDLLSGLLSNAAYLNTVGRFYHNSNNFSNPCMNVGQVFIAIDPSIVYGANFFNEVDNYIELLKNSRKTNNNIIRIPGESKLLSYSRTMKEGFEISDKIIDDFLHLTKML